MSEVLRAPRALTWLVISSVLLTGGFYLWLALQNSLVGFAPDDAVYLLMADVYSPSHRAAHGLGAYIRENAQFPPLFPLFLALLGAGADALVPARMGVALSFLAAAVLFGVWLRLAGVPRWSAFALALFSAWWPVNWIMVADVWSEGLYLCLVWLCLWALSVARRTPQVLVWALLAGLLAGCAWGTRSIGIALVPAVLVALLPRGRYAVMAAVLGWLLVFTLCRQLAFGGNASYGEELLKFYREAPLTALLARLSMLRTTLADAALYDLFLWRGMTFWRGAVLVLTVALVALGALRERRRLRPVLIYCLGYGLVIALWPFPSELNRFLVPLLPFALMLLWRGVAVNTRREWPGLLLVGVLLALCLPQMSECLRRVWTPLPVAALDHWRTTRYWLDATRGEGALGQIAALEGYRRAAIDLGQTVPPEACVFTPQVHLVLWYARRRAFETPPAQPDELPCRWIHAVGEQTGSGPPFYPLTQWSRLLVVAAWSRDGQRLPLPTLTAASYLARQR